MPIEMELQPWLIFSGKGPDATIATWQIAHIETPAIAMFTSESHAHEYAQAHCVETSRILQLDPTRFIRVLVEAYRAGSRYAAVDPHAESARQVFVLREVLTAAKRVLVSDRG
ncbi:MAG: hypothetical protein R3C53_05825 [Pirellulaceae bacterium]